MNVRAYLPLLAVSRGDGSVPSRLALVSGQQVLPFHEAQVRHGRILASEMGFAAGL